MSEFRDNHHRFEQFRAGNRDALREYHRLYGLLIVIFLWHRIGNREMAIDRARQVFRILSIKRESIANEEDLLAFLLEFAEDLSKNYRQGDGPPKKLEDGWSLPRDPRSSSAEVREAELVKEEVLMALRASFLQLPARKRRIIVLYYFHRKSSKEIAARLRIRRQTVLNHLSQSIIRLRKDLDGRWEEASLFFS
jgi:RNA polymerase sigma factor (sigma-70 family)